MFFYILLFVSVLLLSFISLDKHINTSQRSFIFFIILISLSLIAGTRLMGYDFDTYSYHFKNVKEITEYSRTNISIEYFYDILASITKYFTIDFNIFLTIYTILLLSIAGIFFNKYSPYPILSFCMFICYAFCLQVMGQMRQPFGIFVSYLILIPLILNKRNILAILYILFAGLVFHKSLYFCLLLFVFKDKVISYKNVILILSVSIILYSLSEFALKNALAYLPEDFYLSNVIYEYVYYKVIKHSFSLGMLERVILFFIMFYVSNKYRIYQENRLFRFLLNSYLMGICIYYSFIKAAAEFASRGSFFYIYSFFILMPILIKEVPVKVKYFLLLVTFLWSFYVSTSVIREASEDYIPYKNTIF